MNFLIKVKNKIIKELILAISRIDFNLSVINRFYLFILELAGENIYFVNQNKKDLIIGKVRKINQKKIIYYEPSIEIDNYVKNLNDSGICSELDIGLSENESNYVLDYFSKKHFYDSHTPIISNRKNFDQKPSGAYMSYDLNTQLNCKPLLELCLNEKIIKSAQKYLECPPILFSINTFKTLPNQKAFTHSFHRDLDDFLWLTVFVYWTNTTASDGAFEQIKCTHRKTEFIENIIEKNFKGLNYDSFYRKTLGYDNFSYEDYIKIFGNENVCNIYGNKGKVVFADTAGLHRGTKVINERLVTWLRYGITGSRQKNYAYEKQVKLDPENQSIFNKSKNKAVLKNIL